MARTTPTAPPKLGLRERKKIQTRQAIRRAAYRLFEEQGYDATPVDQIAEAADVSPSTVFRYFPTKEDIVLTDEYDPLIVEQLRARPLDEPPVTSLRHAIVGLIRQYAEDARGEMLIRLTLIRQVPALRGRMSEGLTQTGDMLGEVLAERSGRATDDLDVRVVVAAVLGALQEAVFHCFDRGRIEDMEKDIDYALEVLARGLTL
ncbi:TetR/AcrR family transcriptional regulator [Streptomyces sp. ME19-01-6]|uniref:TetR/AcrR family transcriptional regulator n=1 Tax=Streptomyces sp. ME19-01-6 TaxID=3028686 RepID=UPI0029BA311F|nr:TetR family transcriptional regulator [Streptomyces sp. ME19-01-6]MDX3225950.1 TetR family transcriptional regulator [Streptomyces sp. ME19-01-6]